MKISAYSTAFNLENFKIDINEAISNWLVYCDEVVVATTNDEYKKIKDLISSELLNKVKIVSSNINIKEDLYWDGKLKNLSLQNCSNEVVIQIDLDERISGNPEHFEICRKTILDHNFPCSVMIPTLNLYGDLDHYKDISFKWYMHTKKDTFRGAVEFAINEDGSFDPEKSDTCELLTKDGRLAPCIAKINYMEDQPKIIHLGTLDFSRKAHINQKFWRKVWSHRKTLSQGRDVDAEDIFTDSSEFKDTKIKHNLKIPLWPTI
tara:strand:- start:212 stop:1000 length:789 start_codon:yes stop_codon:yes gene_type:complete